MSLVLRNTQNVLRTSNAVFRTNKSHNLNEGISNLCKKFRSHDGCLWEKLAMKQVQPDGPSYFVNIKKKDPLLALQWLLFLTPLLPICIFSLANR